MAKVNLTKRKAQSMLVAAFLKNGYIRSRNEKRLKKEGGFNYRKGFEVRLVLKDKKDLKLIQAAIVALDYNLSKSYINQNQIVQPIYGMALSDQFQKLQEQKEKAVKKNSKLVKVDKTSISHNFKKIESMVCKHFEIRSSDLKSESRLADLVLARQLIMFLAREHTSLSTIQIGEYLGGRNHTTVLFAVNKMKTLYKKDKEIKQLIQKLTKKL